MLSRRTRYLTVVLENIYQPHNASAVLRTCDACGIQDAHIIETRNRYRINPDVELGSARWLTLYRYASQSTEEVMSRLRANGYRIIATTPHANLATKPTSVPASFDLDAGKAALLFGNELEGLSQLAIHHSDELLSIPMAGFVESFNISVSAAIMLSQLGERLRESAIHWQLTDDERRRQLELWLRNRVKQ